LGVTAFPHPSSILNSPSSLLLPSCLARVLPLFSYVMGVSEILNEIESLPAEQRWQILERTREMLGSEIPESFKQGMQEIAHGEVIELDKALETLEERE
jgi:hypothetical protein